MVIYVLDSAIALARYDRLGQCAYDHFKFAKLSHTLRQFVMSYTASPVVVRLSLVSTIFDSCYVIDRAIRD